MSIGFPSKSPAPSLRVEVNLMLNSNARTHRTDMAYHPALVLMLMEAPMSY